MNITVDRAVIEQALEALETIHATLSPESVLAQDLNRRSTALRTALEQPTRSQKMADAGFTPHDTRLTCDECGGQFTRQILPVHKCTALEQPEQEPVAYIHETGFLVRNPGTTLTAGTKLYAAPKREWVGLTEDQFLEASRLAEDGNYMVAFQRIQQWLKEKNV